jgi:hypothetical protein
MRRDPASHAFLGQEFLTWLWFRADTRDATFELSDRRRLGVALDDYLAFAAADDDQTEQTLRRGLPTASAEAAAALRNGRVLRRAKLILAVGEATWTATLDGPTMTLSGVRGPDDSEACESEAERNAERAGNCFALADIIAELYGHFLRDRLRRDYAATSGEAQARWMAGG